MQSLRTITAVTASGPLLALLGAGCGPNVDPDPTNRGSGSDSYPVKVENAFIVPDHEAGACAEQFGDDAVMSFTITNNDTTTTERLLDITTSDAASVRVEPAPPIDIPPRSSIAALQPSTSPADRDGSVSVRLLDLADTARPNTTVDVRFSFEHLHDLQMNVPVDACPRQQWPGARSGG